MDVLSFYEFMYGELHLNDISSKSRIIKHTKLIK